MLEKLSSLISREDAENRGAQKPLLSCVVIVHDMVEQAEKTILSLSEEYQLDVQSDQYEVIIVENQSDNVMRQEFIESLPDNFHYFIRENPEPSPGPAVNYGVSKAIGDKLCILIDGARLLSPRAISTIIQGHKLSDAAVISIPGYHLGHKLQQEAVLTGYDSAAEATLLKSVGWPENGYRLFDVSCLNGSSGLGFFLPNSESNCISLSRQLWEILEGYDSRFKLRGGGLVNLDFYKRALELPGTLHVILAGEGTFHQLHGGMTTGGLNPSARAKYIQDSNEQYREFRGQDFENPRTEPVYLGRLPIQVQKFVQHSAQLAIRLEGEECLGKPF
ncbi:MAG: glycosyltransferase family A protein [Halieaceae bacterium]